MAIRVYIAGPMRNHPLYNFPAFDRARDFLTCKGFAVISPADLDRHVGFTGREETTPTREFMRHAIKRDLLAVMEVDAVAMLPGWEDSKGACLEKQLAEFLGLTILDATTGRPLVE